MAAAVFTQRTCQVPASAYFQLDSSLVQAGPNPIPTYAVAGAHPYVVYEPSSTAVAAAGYGDKLPLIVVLHARSSGLQYTNIASTNVQMVSTDMPGAKLGWGAAQDGSANAPIQTWPTLVAFPQFIDDWSGAYSTDPNLRKTRAAYMVIDATIDDVIKNYNVDRSRIYFVAASSGGFTGWSYLYGRATRPWGFKYDIAGALMAMTGFGLAERLSIPDNPTTESRDDVLRPKYCRAIHRAGTPIYSVNSSSDDGGINSAYYSPIVSIMQALKKPGPTVTNTITDPTGNNHNNNVTVAGNYVFKEYVPSGAPGHTQGFNAAFGGDYFDTVTSTGGPMLQTDPNWAWLLAQKFIKRPSKYSRLIRRRAL